MITRRAGPKPGVVFVTFQLPASTWAETVHLVGDFNGWDRQSHPLVRSRDDDSWRITLELEEGRARLNAALDAIAINHPEEADRVERARQHC